MPEYQIMQAIRVLSKVKMYQNNFIAIFTGSGDTNYIKSLRQEVEKFELKDHILFAGYKNDLEMKLFYSACDLFFMTSIKNAGPVATYKAILMELPIITTDSGRAAEILRLYNAGKIIPPSNYSAWTEALLYALNKNLINIINRNEVKNLWEWEKIVNNWRFIFHTAIEDFQNTRQKNR